MDTPNLGKDLSSAAEKTLNLKNILTIVFFVVVVMLLFNWVFKMEIIDENNVSQGVVKYRLRSFKKSETQSV